MLHFTGCFFSLKFVSSGSASITSSQIIAESSIILYITLHPFFFHFSHFIYFHSQKLYRKLKYIYIYIYIHTHTQTYKHMHAYAYIYVYTVYAYAHVHIYIIIYIYTAILGDNRTCRRLRVF